MQAALRERYALLPYIYTLFRDANATGAPIMRPLWYDFPQQSDLFTEEHAFMLGPALLSAPVLDDGVSEVTVPFPGGVRWYDAVSGALAADVSGGRKAVPVTADSMPRCDA